jgi:hypothetical protein
LDLLRQEGVDVVGCDRRAHDRRLVRRPQSWSVPRPVAITSEVMAAVGRAV